METKCAADPSRTKPAVASGSCVGMGLAEGVGFEPTKDVTALTRLAGGRTRPLCDPSVGSFYAFAGCQDNAAGYGTLVSAFARHNRSQTRTVTYMQSL